MFTRTRTRTMVAVSALLFGSSALVGVGFSGATWTHTTSTPVSVTASPDWTPPTVSVATLPAGIFGTTTVTATAADARSAIGSVTLEYAPAGGTTWTTISTGCTASSGTSPLVYSCQWATTGVPDGDYEVRARTTDTASPIAYDATSLPVPTQIANTTSVVLTTVPDHVRGSVTLTAGFLQPVSGNTRLYVDYLNGATWTQIDSCTAAKVQSLNCSWNTTTFADGTYELRARAENGNLSWTDEQSGVVVDNQAPTVTTFTLPAGVLSGAVTLSAIATDAVAGVASVAFDYQLQGTPAWTVCGVDTTPATFTCDLNTTGLLDGTYNFRATATDAAGNVSSSVTQSRTVDNSPGSVAITSPSNGTIVSGTAATVTWSAASGRGVASVRIDYRLAGGTFTPACAATSPSTSCSWTLPLLANAGYELRAVMSETYGGGSVTSATVPVRVITAPAVVLDPIASPTKQNVPLRATFYNAGAGTVSIKMQYTVTGGSSWSNASGCTAVNGAVRTCTWAAPNGVQTYDVRVQAVFNSITYGDVVTGVLVDPTAPTVTLTALPAAPLNGTVNMAATAADVGSGVASVLFEYRLTGAATWTSCGTSTSTPYVCSLDTTALADGGYDFRATVTDVAGNSTASTTQVRAVDNSVTSISISSPTGGSTVRGTVAITAAAASNRGIASVRIEAGPTGGALSTVCTATTAPYSCAFNSSTITYAAYDLRAVLTQGNGVTVTSAIVTVTIDNTVLKASDVQATNSGTQGIPTPGDKILLTYSTLVDLTTIRAGWDGSSQSVAMTMSDTAVSGGSVAGADWAAFSDANLGQVAFGQNYVSPNSTVTFANGTIAATQVTVGGVPVTRVTITLGTPGIGLLTNNINATMNWTPSTLAKDTWGNACLATVAVESGGGDKDL